ncbi:DUF5667 domain-containing protein [Klenkia brasiliensis]|uniref:DUF5667 domain-containing protein n=1 Tax=Klenkia brasiliensis TaxID=333142 RepID=A0A1G7QVS3_9ACTN|nr:DUF5667 domain-containing protein [Klenkia brasiliensis]SDG02631.1 hypothetical protein SAMN05660324_1641 [Klenkia brasiliensis]
MTVDDEGLEEALVGRLRLLAHDEPGLGEDVRAAQRARLVAMAAVRPAAAGAAAVRGPAPALPRWRRALAGRPADAPWPRWRARLTAGMAGAAVTVGALSGLVALAQGAEPGDLLYGLKRGTEQTQLALASDADRGLTLLGFATTRLDELAELTGEDAGALPAAVGAPDGSGQAVAAAGVDPATVVDLLITMDEQTTEGTSSLTTTVVGGGDPGALATLTDWAAGQRAGLAALDLPAGAQDAVAASLVLVDQVAARATSWQTALTCPDGPTTAGLDDLGPVAGACAVPATTPSAAPSTAAPTTGSTAEPAPGGGTGTGTAPTSAAPPATAAPTGGGGGSGGGGGTLPTTGGAPATTTLPPAVPTSAPVPTVGLPAATTTPPVVQVPVPVPSTTVCLGGLICVGG